MDDGTVPPRRLAGDLFFETGDGLIGSDLLWIAAAYAVHGARVLLCLHNRFRMWVPPGGHVGPGETFSEAAAREFREETGLSCRVLSAGPVIHPPDSNANPEPLPFYSDLLREGFRKPAHTLYYFVEPREWPSTFDSFQREELDDIGLFSAEDLAELQTFSQVRSLAAYALTHHPSADR